jgi:hypothetical protein
MSRVLLSTMSRASAIGMEMTSGFAILLSITARQVSDNSSTSAFSIGTFSMSSVPDILWNDSSSGSSEVVPRLSGSK